MIKHTNYRELPGFSKLFCDFIDGNEFFDNRFPFNKKLTDTDALNTMANKFSGRAELSLLIQSSMNSIELNYKQKENLEAIANRKSLAIVTGQQAGFLGGPLYTLLKAKTAINKATELQFVPVFWVEDNDHDNLEASQAVVYDRDYKVRHIFCESEPQKNDRTCVAYKKYNDYIKIALDEIESCLPLNDYAQKVIEQLRKIYVPGKRWGIAFIELVNLWLADSGILFVSATKAREMGLFASLASKEIENLGKSTEIIKSANEKLEAAGYHIQAKSLPINLFLHNADKRNKIYFEENKFRIGEKIFSLGDLQMIAANDNTAFSPNVLLRPIFQDKVLPTAAYIGGPSEIGYCAQIHELYEYFGVSQPAILPRDSATIILPAIARFLEKNSLDASYFYRNYLEIETEVKKSINDNNINETFNSSKQSIDAIFESIDKIAASIDGGTSGAVGATKHKTMQLLSDLEKKINSAQTKKHSIIFNKYRQASNLIYPEGTHQERLISPISFMATMMTNEILD
jgi:bacillithiol biosynthesis cysteine-adding enzyme BshC